MPNIKEIAPKLTQKLSIAINDDEAVEFAEALIAEIAKQNEPVAYATTSEDGDMTMLFFDDGEARKYSGDDAPIKLYTIPPTAEQIANETAEAIAEYCSNQDHYCLSAEIESGEWKEFKK